MVVSHFSWTWGWLDGIAVAMIGAAAALRRRRGPAPVKAPTTSALERSSRQGPAPVDDDMAEIEEILRRRGIG